MVPLLWEVLAMCGVLRPVKDTMWFQGMPAPLGLIPRPDLPEPTRQASAGEPEAGAHAHTPVPQEGWEFWFARGQWSSREGELGKSKQDNNLTHSRLFTRTEMTKYRWSAEACD